MNRAERKRRAKDDEKLLQRGIDPDTNDPTPTAAMARQMYALFEKAKRSGSIEAPVKFLYAKAAATQAAKPIQLACARGCAHCCNGWVSVTAPEILFAAKQVRARGETLMARVRAAAQTVQGYDMAERPNHPNPCAMLGNNACELYETRPFACRMASSVDATACERVFRLFAADTIPSPLRHIRTREFYQLATTIALSRAGLPHRFYDFTGGLARALSRDDAETAWLSGEDIFVGVRMDPTDMITKGGAQVISRHAFG
jgi:Fe-S-cluster containining protein